MLLFLTLLAACAGPGMEDRHEANVQAQLAAGFGVDAGAAALQKKVGKEPADFGKPLGAEDVFVAQEAVDVLASRAGARLCILETGDTFLSEDVGHGWLRLRLDLVARARGCVPEAVHGFVQGEAGRESVWKPARLRQDMMVFKDKALTIPLCRLALAGSVLVQKKGLVQLPPTRACADTGGIGYFRWDGTLFTEAILD